MTIDRREEQLPAACERELKDLVRATVEGRVTRRELLARALALGISVSAVGALLTACGGGSSEDAAKPAALSTELPESITLFNWASYMSPKVIKGFAAETGVKVKQEYFVNNDDLLAKIKAGSTGYDIIVPSDSLIPQLLADGLVQSLQLDLIPNFAGVTDPILRDSPSDPGTDGKKYSTPYMFGTTGFEVRIDKIKTPGDSWEMLYDPKYKGQISMLNDVTSVLDPALALLGLPLNTTSQADLDAATAKAIEQKPLLKGYNSTDYATLFMEGLPLVNCYDGDAVWATMQLGLSKVKYILPKEGYLVWCDAFAVLADAPNPYAAHLFINYVLDPKNSALCADSCGYQPAVAAADPYIKSLVQRAMRPTEEVLAAGTLAVSAGDFQSAWDEAWKKIKKA